MRKTDSRPKPQGLKGEHYGYYAHNHHYSPTEFAMAFIAVHDRKALEGTLAEEIKKYDKKEITAKDVPLFFDLIQKYHTVQPSAESYRSKGEEEQLAKNIIDEMDKLSFAVNHSHKFINDILVEELHPTPSMSVKDQISLRIHSRKRETARNPSRPLTLINPTIRKEGSTYHFDDLNNFRFTGGSKHATKGTQRRNEWSNLPHEKSLLEIIAKKARIPIETVTTDYTTPLITVDFDAALGLTYAARKQASNPAAIKRLPEARGEIILPFDFSKNPRYAFEAFLRMYSNLRGKNKEKTSGSRMYGIDQYLMGKDITAIQFKEAYQKHAVTKTVKISGKSYPKNAYSWAIVQAFHIHNYMRHRNFDGHTRECDYNGTEVIASSFKNTAQTPRNAPTEHSVRILYTENLLPVAMYKTVIPAPVKKNAVIGLHTPPVEQVNYAKSRATTAQETKGWIEYDEKSGKYVHVVLREPEQEIFELAAKILQENNVKWFNGKKVDAFKLRGLYMDQGFAYREKNKQK